MKPAPFAYERPASLREAVRILAEVPGAKVLAGGQTLGPMLNLRLAQPEMIVDIGRIAELAQVSEDADAISIGATVTHAAIEDGRMQDPTGGFLRNVAKGIAYRAVRTRGTVGGSLAHADPAADWLSALTALGAEVVLSGSHGASRTVALAEFARGAMQADLAPDEIVVAIRMPKFSRAARFGFHKICRKTGEFAEAIGVAVEDPERGIRRLVAGATEGRPIVLDLEGDPNSLSVAALEKALSEAGYVADAYTLKLHAVALRRACQEASAS
jgi:carbon-monoxide dehydrogenase medium subunit